MYMKTKSAAKNVRGVPRALRRKPLNLGSGTQSVGAWDKFRMLFDFKGRKLMNPAHQFIDTVVRLATTKPASLGRKSDG
jgi:hypothetical protein